MVSLLYRDCGKQVYLGKALFAFSSSLNLRNGALILRVFLLLCFLTLFNWILGGFDTAHAAARSDIFPLYDLVNQAISRL